MVYVKPEDADMYLKLIESDLTYQSQDGLTAQVIYGDHTYELQLKEVSDDIYILISIKEVR